MHWIGILSLLAALAGSATAQSTLADFRVETYAGSDSIRDGGPATDGLLHQPHDVAADSAGNIYIADEGNGLVRRVGTDGVITTVAGRIDRIGSGPLATEQTFYPDCVAVAPGDRVHFCSSRQVYELLPDGTTRVVAGTGSSTGAGNGQPAVEAGFIILSDIDFGPDGSLYILDRGRDVVRRVRPDGVIEAFAGTGEAGFSGDGGPAVEAQIDNPSRIDAAPDGSVLIGDSGNQRVRRVDPDGVIATVAGIGERGIAGDGGPATEAALNSTTSVLATPDGGFLVSNFAAIRRVDSEGVINFYTGAGTGRLGDGEMADRASFNAIQGMDYGPDGSLYIADLRNQRIRRIGPDDIVETFAGGDHLLGDGGPATQAQLFQPRGLALDGQGNLYIADVSNSVVRRVAADGTISTIAGSGGTGSYGEEGPATEVRLRAPIDVAIHPVTSELYILDAADGRVRRVDSAGMMTTVVGTGRLGTSGDGGPAVEAQIQFPQTITFSPTGDMYLSDIFAHVVRKVSGGVITTVAGTGTAGSEGDGGPAASAQLSRPYATIAVESGELYIAESNRIRRVAADGTISTLTEVQGDPNYLSLSRTGDLLAAVPRLNRIYRIGLDGEVEQLAGFGFGFQGDGGSVSQASFSGVAAVVEAPDGDLFVSDEDNHRVRLIVAGPTLARRPVLQAASFFGGAMSAETIVSLFGSSLADDTAAAESTPLPTTLGGTTVIVRDSAGVEREASLFFVSPGQINMMIPAGTAFGDGVIVVRTASGRETQAPLAITTATPGLFAANANGKDVAAAFALRVDGAGVQTTSPVFQLSESGQSFVPAPIDLGPNEDQIYLILFGTGVRGAPSVRARLDGVEIPTTFFGPQGGFVGLDQINIGPIPRNFAGKGEVTLRIEAVGRASNNVTVAFR